jgi:hypothetical protein
LDLSFLFCGEWYCFVESRVDDVGCLESAVGQIQETGFGLIFCRLLVKGLRLLSPIALAEGPGALRQGFGHCMRGAGAMI